MIETICRHTVEKTESQLYSLMVETQLVEIQHRLSQLNEETPVKEEWQKQLFLLSELANRQAIKARERGELELYQAWSQILDLLDATCDRFEGELEDDSYLIY